ncbi:General control protein [Neurospora sp. IMI 360204]|nr:General control protein [Neurospora sp. IMI 360204]
MRLQPHAELDLLDFATFDGGATTEAAFASPANQTYDLSSSVPSSVSNMGTVSPQELLLHEPYLSAPSSTALTALTSPSIFDGSPDFDTFDISPSFGHSDLDNPDSWFSLFPDANPLPQAQTQIQTQTQAEQQTQPQPELIQSVQETVQPTVEQTVHSVEASPATQSEDLEVSSPGSGHQRRKSSVSSPSGRHSSVAGVGSRRRDKPLPPIIVEDPSDVVAMKRARNTLAARKSRERKAQRLDELEAKIEELIAERDRWKNLALAHGASTE